ncbi:AHH domain-containing protein [Pseudoalteromonas sp. NZS37]|uniref:AHH domain-containing protein n=2 Tax=unclassified Pseudoalteromonas TaxID=194690 RepID=UPI0018CCBF4A|nr:AHH domain-containing protein [Pseudoalteromonas sp. NZS37]
MDLLYVYQDGSPVKNAPYTIKFDDGTQSTGQLGEDGIAQLTDVPNGQFTVQYGEDTREYEPQDNTTPNPLYKRITPASAIQMSRAGQTATLDEASNIASQAGDWLWGALQGDFNKDPTTARIVVGSIISMIPIIDQVMDVRDILANVMLLTDDDKANDNDGWIAFTLTAIGLVPVLGSAVKGVGKVVIKNSGDTIEAAIAVLRKLGKGDPVQYLRKINWQDLGKQAASEVKAFIKGLRDTLHEISTSWQYDLLLPQLAIDGMQATIKQLDEIAPKIDQGVKGAASEIGNRVNKALDEFEPPKSTGIVGKPKKSVANELDAPKGNDLKGAAVKNRKFGPVEGETEPGWGKLLRKYGAGEPPESMQNPHAHHSIFKKGRGKKMIEYLDESKDIVERYDIDWYKGPENLGWAPNKNHSTKAAKAVRDYLVKVEQNSPSKESIIKALQEIKKHFANDTIHTLY